MPTWAMMVMVMVMIMTVMTMVTMCWDVGASRTCAYTCFLLQLLHATRM